MTQSNRPLRARPPDGGILREVLLGPVESFHWMADNAAYS